MQEMQYFGEHLWPGRIGHFGVLLGFVSSLLATLAYYFATSRRDLPEASTWKKIGRGAFFAHAAGTFAIIGMLFFVMLKQYYEYQYVQAHVSEDLNFKYIFSAFWEGQEGSFLLWMFWHIILGVILIFKSGSWESPVMATLMSIQAIIGSMILGVYIGFGEDAMRLGSNPTLLLREVMDAPIFSNENYVSLIKGNGLNPLLQNYWMTIHPPTLFLGFASTSIPFCFAVAGLWTRRHTEWMKPAFPWALFSGSILGTGILMGGAWAYEALSFGGYWAWDPVENMSLVPWIILIAGIHTNLIAKHTGYAIRSTYLYYLLTFVMIVYSTFLTRSGVLGQTSVHAFTEMGLEWQLVFFIVAYLGVSLWLLASRYKGIPSPSKEEAGASKEFWMFIGSLVLLFSAVLISASTSLPVYNKIVQYFDPTFEGRVITDPVEHYNKYQLWIGIFIGLLSGFTQYLRFREFNWKSRMNNFLIRTGIAVVLSAALTGLMALWINTYAWQYSLLLFSGIFTVVTNLDYLFFFLKGNLKTGASAIAHIGFGVMLAGIIASGLNKQTISSNPFVMEGLIEGADEQSLRRNILLFKGSPTIMSGYEVTYTHDTLQTYTRTYTVNYKRRNKEGEVIEEFNLQPNILYDKTFTKVASSNPSTKRYAGRDVFTHIASLPQIEMDMEFRRQREDSLKYRLVNIDNRGPKTFLDTVRIEDQDTFVIKQYTLSFDGLDRAPAHPEYTPKPGDLAIGVRLRVERSDDDSVYAVMPVLVLREELLYSYPIQINQLSARVRLSDAIFGQLFTSEDELKYESITFKEGETTTFKGLKLNFSGFNKTPEHPMYKAADGDIAVGADMQITDATGRTFKSEPVYYIRGSRPFNLKDEVEDLGLHLRFVGIDPAAGSITLMAAKTEPRNVNSAPVEIATNSLRSDYIVLEAIEFPGINLFWMGSILMMLGLGLGMWRRMGTKADQPGAIPTETD
ncbi:MAG: cytochrome c biogenesis protein CcsA [Saprospiraceae bacterium]|nr:cytochrome c biogenesis protein CcsA [Saprospiraceae bacterium]